MKKYTLTVTEYGRTPETTVTETTVTEDREVYMDAVYAAVNKGGMWIRGQTTYFAMVHHYSPLMAGDNRVKIAASYE